MLVKLVHVIKFLISFLAGTINTDIALMGKRDVIPYRIGVFAFISLVMVTAYSGFEFFYETIRHVPGPMHHAVIYKNYLYRLGKIVSLNQ